MKWKALFVGQAPNSQPVDPDKPALSGRPVRRLASLMDVSVEQFFSTFDTMNLLAEHPGKSGKGDAFPLAPARKAAQQTSLEGWPRLVLLGRNVAAAFWLAHLPYLEWVSLTRINKVGSNSSFQATWISPHGPAPTVMQAPLTPRHKAGPGFVEVCNLRVAVVPHPSGVNRWWNEPANVEAAGRFLRELWHAVAGTSAEPAPTA